MVKDEFYTIKEICFKNLNINILYEVLQLFGNFHWKCDGRT